jgi:hypothetical protein
MSSGTTLCFVSSILKFKKVNRLDFCMHVKIKPSLLRWLNSSSSKMIQDCRSHEDIQRGNDNVRKIH